MNTDAFIRQKASEMLVTLYSKYRSMLDSSKYVDGIVQGYHVLRRENQEVQGIPLHVMWLLTSYSDISRGSRSTVCHCSHI